MSSLCMESSKDSMVSVMRSMLSGESSIGKVSQGPVMVTKVMASIELCI